jgi:diguanylate cyclase (GGDEF)-like protein
MRMRNWLEQRSAAVTVAGSVVLALGIGLADFFTSEEFSLAIFYLVPVLGSTWLAGRRAGLVIAALCAVTSVGSDLYSIPFHPPAVHAWNLLMRLGFFGVTAALHASLRRALERERSLARRDPLTGLSNRTAFVEAAEAELARSRRYEHPLTVAYLDCDHFKEVNDTKGHQAGDRVLWLIGHTLEKTVRKTDVAARLGGDEFALLFPELAAGEARDVIAKIHAKLLAAMQEAGMPVTFSIGVVSYQRAPEDFDTLLHRADELMYEVKRAGRNSLRFEASSGNTDPRVALLSAS